MAFTLKDGNGYFRNKGVDLMAFDDIYPDGHQAGVSIIMHGERVASNGDVRFRNLAGQWRPVPKQGERAIDEEANTITTSLAYPDKDREVGFSPIVYPDIKLDYKVTVRGVNESVIITVDLDAPVPDDFIGHVCLTMELFPGALFGKPWIMDEKQGIFPVQPNGPFEPVADINSFDIKPYAVGKNLTIRPDDPYGRCKIESKGSPIHLYDARATHNDGWFVLSSDLLPNTTKEAAVWVITPNVVDDWLHTPVVQLSQVGYHPNQPKTAVIELDRHEKKREKVALYKITKTGEELVREAGGDEWGSFLRYNYLKFDFTEVKTDGLYKVRYGTSESSIFRIGADIYERGVWQPVLEYFLPVQMCHMRVQERFRVWHDLCHMDDALMAPVDHNHFDGYIQGPSTMTKYKPGEHVPGLNIGGWHDAGDDDLRVESQAGECYILAMAYESFGVDYDTTTIDQTARIVDIHKPDGKNDILQQIEHGALSIVGAYRALGRLYRGIIVNNLRQYVMLGDTAAQTDGIIGNADDRWVFTEDNPQRELKTAAQLAAVSRALKGFNDELSAESLKAAQELYDITEIKDGPISKETPWHISPVHTKIHAAVELFLTTGDEKYKEFLLSNIDEITGTMDKLGWIVARVDRALNDKDFSKAIGKALPALKENLKALSNETPYGIPYRPHIWGAGWDIQRRGFEYYFLHKAYPDVFEPDFIYNALNFVLGCHPGSNNMSFASGVGTKSALVAYGWNRADWSFYPGGVISGTALIRPDFPELLNFPFLWQQTEYVIGGGSSNYMFLVLAVQNMLS